VGPRVLVVLILLDVVGLMEIDVPANPSERMIHSKTSMMRRAEITVSTLLRILYLFDRKLV
jgi:hypothetical protein